MNTQKFLVFVDAGHGGIDPTTRKYTTPGKRFYHEGCQLHEGGWYYEGVENRIVANRFMELLKEHGIPYVQLHHDWKDDLNNDLYRRAELVNKYIRAGGQGYVHSFHSNAVGSDNPRREQIQGYTIWTTHGQNFSDAIAEVHFRNIRSLCDTLPENYWRTDKKDGDADYEEDFYILRKTNCPAILEEFGFHTSKEDTLRIIAHREQRAQTALQTALWAKQSFEHHGLA